MMESTRTMIARELVDRRYVTGACFIIVVYSGGIRAHFNCR
jgi:hypothetical protein